jgi:hypothetical protein
LLVAPLAWAQSAQDKAAAEVLFNDATKALGEGRFADACPKFAESQRLDPAIGTALYLGECYERSGKIASAWAMFREAQDLALKRNDAKRAAIAKDRADKLVPSKLTIALGPGLDGAGLEVKRDGVAVSAVTFGAALPLDGGPHTITASAAGHAPFSTTVTIPERGGNVTVTIPKWDDKTPPPSGNGNVTPPPSGNVTPPPSGNVTPPPGGNVTPPPGGNVTPPPGGGDSGGSGSGLRIAGLALAGVGVVGLGAGVVFAALAGGKFADSNKYCYNETGADGVDPCIAGTPGPSLRSDAKTFAAVSTGLVIGGAALAVGGLTLFLVAPKSKPTSAVRVTPAFDAHGGGLFLTGHF